MPTTKSFDEKVWRALAKLKAQPRLPKSDYPWAFGNDRVRLRYVVDGFTGEGLLFLDAAEENGRTRIFKVALTELPPVKCSDPECSKGES